MLKFSKSHNNALRFSLLILLLSLSFLLLQKVLQQKPLEVNVVDVASDTDQFVEVSITGSIKGILKPQQNPITYITLSYTDANYNSAKKTVSLDYSSNFRFDPITIPAQSQFNIAPTSDEYTFLPIERKYTRKNLPSNVKFEALPKAAKTNGLSIHGKILGFNVAGTVVYLYGTSSVTGKTVKRIINVDSKGTFVFNEIESGVYAVAPVSYDAITIPKYKTITVKNADFKVNFAQIGKL